MGRVLEYQNLITMLRELHLTKNSIEDIREVLNYIADELEKYINDIK